MANAIRSWIAPLRTVPRDLWIAWSATFVAFLPIYRPWVVDWQIDPNYSQGFLIPLISIYLALRALKDHPDRLSNRPGGAAWIGALLVAIGLAGYVFGTGGAESFTARTGFVLTWLGAAWWIAGGSLGRLLAVPTLFLLFSVPVPAVIYYNLSVPLQTVAAISASLFLKGVGVPAVRDGNMILLPGTALEVADACSGIRSLTVLLALGALWAHLARGSAARRAILFACTIPLAVLGNGVRVSLTSLGVYIFGPSVAEGATHEAMGLVVFLVTLTGLYAVSRILKTDA